MILLAGLLPALFFAGGLVANAQSIHFQHVNTSTGLSENNVRSIAIDKNGFLWIGTIDGLNVYDGYSVMVCKKETQPEMASNNIIHMTCDRRNRLWLGTYEGVTWLDERRAFHRVVLNDSVSKFGCRTVMDTKAFGPVLYTNLGQFFFNEKKRKWERLEWIPRWLEYRRFHDAEPFDENKIIYATDSLVTIVDYAENKIAYQQPFTAVFSVCRYSDHELAIGLQHGQIQIVDIRTKQVVKKYLITSELNKKKINATLTEVRLAVNGSLLVATEYAGLVIIDRAGNISSYVHDPSNPESIGANLTWRVLSGSNGDIVVGTMTGGVSIFNIYNKQAWYKRLFNDGKGNLYDSYVSEMTEDKDGVLWIGALERLIKWDKENNSTTFYYYDTKPIWTGAQNIEIRSVCVDKLGRVWVSALGDWISVLDKTTGEFKKILRDTSLGPLVKDNYVTHLYAAPGGIIWAGTDSGFYTIDPVTLRIKTLKDYPLLKGVENIRVNSFLEDRSGNMWIATYNGVYRYNQTRNKVDSFSTKQGLASNRCHTLSESSNGDIYVCTLAGFSVISGDSIRTYNRSNGLNYDHCEGILEDNNGMIWIANSKQIIRFDPVKKSMQYFDKNSGITTEGFRMGSFLKNLKGELFWGSRAGINHFFPDELIYHAADLKVNIYQADTPDSAIYLGSRNDITFKYRNNSFIFRFNAINLNGARNVQYQYQLEGYDEVWQKGVDVRQARYSSLPAGHYAFKVKASTDGINWIDSSKRINVTIIPPLWQRWWFVGIIITLIIGIMYAVFDSRNKKFTRQKEQLETEQAINYFASSLSEQQTEENILWDVARNCIGRLQFEDCVVYLLDEAKGELIQKAAYGPKSPKEFEITKPLGIPVGKGIVGSVTLTGKAEIVSDTTKDPRYIVDDEQRFSEITVPIVFNGKVLGVIDCEHSKKRFFTQKHLSILTTIASLCANKIVRTRAENEKQRTHTMLMDTQQKMTEVEMQALRAQMNPHFIFNCLNSINRYIVKSDQATASLYLTRFAKLIRLILDNSNSKNVILSNELEALKLYIEMEALRFDKKFSYHFDIANNISADSIEVPPLIIQPYVENAIWHGLLHKENGGMLIIRVKMINESMLQCEVEDNGIGREKARELKSKSAISRKSLGMKLTESRLSLLNKYAAVNASIDIVDLKEENGESSGTKVILKIPV